MDLRYIDLEFLKPHEETIPKRVKEIEEEIKGGKEIPPIVVVEVDSYFVVIDGHHRVKVARNLGFSKILAYILSLEEYLNNEKVKLFSWNIMVPKSYIEGKEDWFEKREEDVLYLKNQFRELVAKKVIEELEESEYKFIPGDSEIEIEEGYVLIKRKPFSKKEVIERALEGKLFPPKSTRHILDLT